MSSIIGSQGLVLATAMVVSSTFLYLTFSRQIKTFQPPPQLQPNNKNLRSCLCSGDKKRGRKKKKVQFAENVKMEPNGNGEEFRKEQSKQPTRKIERNCRGETEFTVIEVEGMPPNRIALYNGILRDRLHRMECSC